MTVAPVDRSTAPAAADPGAARAPDAGLLALMHPEGRVRSARARPDLIRLSPTRAQCRDPGWLERATARLERELAPDGLAYVRPPVGWRRRVARRLRAAGLLVGPPIAHVRAGSTDRFLIPLRDDAVRFAAEALLPLPDAARGLGRRLTRLPGWRRAAVELWPFVGLPARRAGGRPPFAWLTGGGGADRAIVVVNAGGARGGATVVHAPGRHVVAKVAGGAGDRSGAHRERERLERLGPTAGRAGAAVPRCIGETRLGERAVLLLTPVPGRAAASVLRRRPGRVPGVLRRIAGWLERWNRATRTVAPLTASGLERALLRPLDVLAPELDDAAGYRARLASLCDRLEGTDLPFVATHGDLTMHNVLLDGHAPGVVDWEGARERGLPLTDLEYAAVDAVAAVDGYRDRAAAWAACRRPAGTYKALCRRLRERLAGSLGIPAPAAELCGHACWLHHALNERRTALAGDARPFLRVLRRVAADTRGGAHG